MSAPGKEGTTGFGERLEILGLRAVLLAYWGLSLIHI